MQQNTCVMNERPNTSFSKRTMDGARLRYSSHDANHSNTWPSRSKRGSRSAACLQVPNEMKPSGRVANRSTKNHVRR